MKTTLENDWLTGGEQLDADELLSEVERYLDAVALFRALGCEPTWGREEQWLHA